MCVNCSKAFHVKLLKCLQAIHSNSLHTYRGLPPLLVSLQRNLLRLLEKNSTDWTAKQRCQHRQMTRYYNTQYTKQPALVPQPTRCLLLTNMTCVLASMRDERDTWMHWSRLTRWHNMVSQKSFTVTVYCTPANDVQLKCHISVTWRKLQLCVWLNTSKYIPTKEHLLLISTSWHWFSNIMPRSLQLTFTTEIQWNHANTSFTHKVSVTS